METVARLHEAEAFYVSALERLNESGVPFMIGGAYAMRQYADIYRDTKDLDVFCKAGDYPRLLDALQAAGYATEITDANWLAKAFHDSYFIDLIFNAGNGLCSVDDTWFEHAPTVSLLGVEVKLIPAEEEIWTKLYIRDRHRYDGADICHIIRKQGPELDWQRLLMRMETHWELLLGQILEFRFVYPSERDAVPRWLMEELISRAHAQLDMPTPKDRICRGNLLSRSDYEIDEREWGYRPK
jgi:hypothetical protein